MQNPRTLSCAAAAVISLVAAALAQSDTLKARLAPVPVESSTLAGMTGSGAATGTLSGRSLSVNGTFEGMQSPATAAQIHLGPKGIRGPAVFDLTVTKAPSGTIGGTFVLTPEQIEAVKRGSFYIQIHSEKAPDGNLWGWLLP